MRLIRTLLGGIAAVTILAPAAQATTLYSNDFDVAATVHTGVTASLTGITGLNTAKAGAWNAAGWAGNYLDNRSTGNPASFTTLSLSNLATHTTVSMSFVLGFLESWDSYNGGCCQPDNLEIWIDGSQVANLTYNNALGSVKDTDGGTVIAEYQQVNNTYGDYSDTLVNMGTASFVTFAHTSSTLTLGIRASGGGWQGSTDEGWGVDKLNITYDGERTVGGVPEPATWALMIGGFGLAGAMLRRRRTVVA